MEQCEELRNYAFHLIGDENLIAVELYLVALQFEIGVYSGEIQYSGEVERIVNVEVYPEQRFVLHWIQSAVERLVVLVFQCARGFCPQRFHAVDDVVLGSIHLFSVFPLGLFTECHGHRHEFAVLVEQFLNLVFVEELLAVVIYV